MPTRPITIYYVESVLHRYKETRLDMMFSGLDSAWTTYAEAKAAAQAEFDRWCKSETKFGRVKEGQPHEAGGLNISDLTLGDDSEIEVEDDGGAVRVVRIEVSEHDRGIYKIEGFLSNGHSRQIEVRSTTLQGNALREDSHYRIVSRNSSTVVAKSKLSYPSMSQRTAALPPTPTSAQLRSLPRRTRSSRPELDRQPFGPLSSSNSHDHPSDRASKNLYGRAGRTVS